MAATAGALGQGPCPPPPDAAAVIWLTPMGTVAPILSLLFLPSKDGTQTECCPKALPPGADHWSPVGAR